ncbi:hypothetical protein [Mesobacterium pallidum]|uniref:hypothetical protein n=1 Tax=Mesobacterium pallidum TaxID=2872037 RepID=UPI001EE20723|nr:hypothetical protein [Mesobacterium pallidum]
MKQKLDIETLETLSNAGVGFLAGVNAPWGGISFDLSVEDLQEFVDDPILWFARSRGVTKGAYLEWMAAGGAVYCSAKTTKGTRCKNSVDGQTRLELHEWLVADEGYCSIHGSGLTD